MPLPPAPSLDKILAVIGNQFARLAIDYQTNPATLKLLAWVHADIANAVTKAYAQLALPDLEAGFRVVVSGSVALVLPVAGWAVWWKPGMGWWFQPQGDPYREPVPPESAYAHLEDVLVALAARMV